MGIKTVLAAAALIGPLLANAAHADLITNGTFAASSYSTNTQFGTAKDSNFTAAQGVTGWTGNNGYNIWFTSAAASTTVNTTGQYTYTGNEKLWSATTPPTFNGQPGGSFIALDGDQAAGVQGSISQMVSGLVVGKQYQLDFDWAGAQVQSRTGATTDQLQATLGSQSFSTSVVSVASKGFSGWMHQTFTFTATAASETLTFLSIGTPSGLPPMALLDNVSLNGITPTAVPEPMTLGLLGMSLAGLGLVRGRRKAA